MEKAKDFLLLPLSEEVPEDNEGPVDMAGEGPAVVETAVITIDFEGDASLKKDVQVGFLYYVPELGFFSTV